MKANTTVKKEKASTKKADSVYKNGMTRGQLMKEAGLTEGQAAHYIRSHKNKSEVTLYNGDCIEELKKVKEGSVDLVAVDLPYGTTACPWDSIIDLDSLWKELYRACKSNAIFVFTAQQPFTWKLCASNPSAFKYELIWEKPNGTNPFAAKKQPMKTHENILVFFKETGTYNPQMEEGKPYNWSSTRTGGEAGGMSKKNAPIVNIGTRYPRSVLKIKQERGMHPTQKPVELMEYIIKTYSNEGDIVLDCTMGSGTTGVASVRTKRKFIGIELTESYFKMAKERIANEAGQVKLV